jgi:membrane peptidoglycan carboxypeptidase
VPFYQVTLSVGPAKVLQLARDAGITTMWTNERDPIDLRPITNMTDVVTDKFDTILGIGQYPVTVLDHANGVATMAAAGLPATAHFVLKVMKADAVVFGETLPKQDQQRILSPQQVNDLTYAMSQVGSAQNLNIGWDTAGKTGTWEYGPDPAQNAHAWMVGFDRQMAAAVWVGNKGDEQPILDKNGNPMYGSGLPATIWRSFMTEASAAMNEPKTNNKFNPPNYLGDTNPPGSVPSPGPGKNDGNGQGLPSGVVPSRSR